MSWREGERIDAYARIIRLALGFLAELRFRRLSFADRAVGKKCGHGRKQSSDGVGNFPNFHRPHARQRGKELDVNLL